MPPNKKRPAASDDATSRAATPPVVLASTFSFETTAQMVEAALTPGSGHLYTRWSNPTQAALEERVAALEGAGSCLVTASGMAAISVALMAAARVMQGAPGPVLVQGEVYGGTHELAEQVLAPLGVEIRRAGVDSLLEAVRGLPAQSTIYLEMPTNPLIRVVDLPAIRAAAPADATIVVDATFATPVNLRPLAHGADVVVHSATKYLAGHHDVVAGAIAGSGPLMETCWTLRKLLGPVLDPAAAYRVWRGLETLELRVLQQNATTLTLAQRLADHAAVYAVHHPGLADHPDHELAGRLMAGAGGVVSFEVADATEARRVADALRRFERAPSLGGVRSLVTWPAGVSHGGLSEADRAATGVSQGLLRLAVGVEPVELLWDDLQAALSSR